MSGCMSSVGEDIPKCNSTHDSNNLEGIWGYYKHGGKCQAVGSMSPTQLYLGLALIYNLTDMNLKPNFTIVCLAHISILWGQFCFPSNDGKKKNTQMLSPLLIWIGSPHL